MNLKPYTAGIKVPEGKSRVVQKVSNLGRPGLSKKGNFMGGWLGSSSSCVAGNEFIGDECL